MTYPTNPLKMLTGIKGKKRLPRGGKSVYIIWSRMDEVRYRDINTH